MPKKSISSYDYDEQGNRRYRDEHFPIDLQKAYDLGKRLVEEKITAV